MIDRDQKLQDPQSGDAAAEAQPGTEGSSPLERAALRKRQLQRRNGNEQKPAGADGDAQKQDGMTGDSYLGKDDEALEEGTEHINGNLWPVGDDGKPRPPSRDDVKQGGLGDCFLMAALIAIVESDPHKIQSMITDHGNGTYTVRFKGAGMFDKDTQDVTTDFAVGKHALVQERHALWPLIIEKAYVQQKGPLLKVHKDGGNAGVTIDLLTNEGRTTIVPQNETAELIMTKLAMGKQKNKPMTANTPKKNDDTIAKEPMMDAADVHYNHAYVILDVDAAGQRANLFNPWQHAHPHGNGWVSVEELKKFFCELNING